MKSFGEIAFTPAVQALQVTHGSRANYAGMQSRGGPDGLGQAEREFLAAADSFYLASVIETGWPYVQHRGGPAGFVKVISPTRIAFADFGGNRQYVSAGNVSKDDRVAIIVMDYANRSRLKLLGRLRFESVEEADPELVFAVELPGYRARVERVAVIDIEAFDWNCPQHSEYRDWDEPQRRRLLLRIWLEAARDRRPVIPQLSLYENRHHLFGCDKVPGRTNAQNDYEGVPESLRKIITQRQQKRASSRAARAGEGR